MKSTQVTMITVQNLMWCCMWIVPTVDNGFSK